MKRICLNTEWSKFTKILISGGCCLTLKRLGRGYQFEFPNMFFPTMYLLERGSSPVFFVTFNKIISHIFPEKFIKFLKLFKRYEDFLR